MNSEAAIEQVIDGLEAGMELAKCRQCGCMQDTLDQLEPALASFPASESQQLLAKIESWKQQMKTVRYSCLGCEHCYPAVAQNRFLDAYPVVQLADLSCDFTVDAAIWPPVVGEYFVLDRRAPVAVSTLANIELAEKLADQDVPGLAIVGKTETENIGIDKIVKNVIANPAIRYLIVAGVDPLGHQSGKTLLALGKSGINKDGRVIGSPGKQAVLRNVSREEVENFRSQVEVVDMIGCEASALIVSKVRELCERDTVSCGCDSCGAQIPVVALSSNVVAKVEASGQPVKLDRAGYFVIFPLSERGVISVEHYSYDNELLHTIEGEDAQTIYRAIIDRGWVSELSHAAYLGRELSKAELSMQYRFKYIQDGA